MKTKDSVFERYKQIQLKHIGKIVLFQIGAFFEIFGDAVDEIAITLSLKQTQKKYEGGLIKMCGFPISSKDEYIKKLIDNGFSVVVALEDGTMEKNRRRVVSEIITPSTSHLNQNYSNIYNFNHIASVSKLKNSIAIMFFDISSGEGFIEYIKISKDLLTHKFKIHNVYEVVICGDFPFILSSEKLQIYHYEYDGEFFNINQDIMSKLTQVERVLLYGILKYIKSTQVSINLYIESIDRRHLNDFYISTKSLIDLSIISYVKSDKNTLFFLLNHTVTSIGRKFLHNTLIQNVPYLEPIKRLEVVSYLVSNSCIIEDIRSILTYIYDVEKLIFRCLNDCLSRQDIIDIIRTYYGIQKLIKLIQEHPNLIDYFGNINFYKNNFIDTNFSETKVLDDKYDDILSFFHYNKDIDREIADLKDYFTLKTGIIKFSVISNHNGSYFIEIPIKYLHLIDKSDEFSISYKNNKKALIVCERLNDINARVHNINENKASKIDEIKEHLMKYITSNTKNLRIYSAIVKNIDLMQSFAKVAIDNNFTQPIIHNGNGITIKDFYHPIYKMSHKDSDIVVNDLILDEKNKCMIITGANMSGKSMYLKQTGVVAFMAMLGCFVPCKEMSICMLSGIFTRIGAYDDLYEDKSTFFIEMEDIASMLNNANEKSLCLIDELGRGTSFEEGIDIATRVIKYLTLKNSAMTICSSHIHSLTEIKKILPEVENYCFKANTINEKIIFDYKIVNGVAQSSMARHTAKLSGIPDDLWD